jgi:hypothetical protein
MNDSITEGPKVKLKKAVQYCETLEQFSVIQSHACTDFNSFALAVTPYNPIPTLNSNFMVTVVSTLN